MLNTSECIYTAITFAPVQGFIEKSRKLRDLYGSSFILSYLAKAICDAALLSNCQVISPAPTNVAQGTPNQIIIQGDYPQVSAQKAFNEAWEKIVKTCGDWIEQRAKNRWVEEKGQYRKPKCEEECEPWHYSWQRAWNAWGNHAWEFFWAQTLPGEELDEVRCRLTEVKRSRNWSGVNWVGESSTLSGADAVAWPGMADKVHPKFHSMAEQTEAIRAFYAQLSAAVGEAIIAPNEQLSIPELVKRLITLETIAKQLILDADERPRIKLPEHQQTGSAASAGKDRGAVETPDTFCDLNRHEAAYWTGWFQGDGDRIGQYQKDLSASELHSFSQALLNWGKDVLRPTVEGRDPIEGLGRLIYAGGDDFLGVLYRTAPEPELSAQECLDWFYAFPKLWQRHGHQITVSVGFVWAAPNVPQRDVLQHCRLAERAAKDGGRDRIALRILFNGGNHLEWICPWWFLEPVLKGYQDRNGATSTNANWTHFYTDVAALQARHAFRSRAEVALALFEIYFPHQRQQLEAHRWDTNGRTGILANKAEDCADPTRSLNDWVIALANVGFHLFRKPDTVQKQAA